MNNKLVLYTTNCPKCRILEKKLQEKNISFSICNDVEEMKKENIYSAPHLKVNDKLLSFYEATQYVNSF